MSIQNDILTELQARIVAVSGIGLVVRNPKQPPKPEDYPAVSIITQEVETQNMTMTGNNRPVYTKSWSVWVVLYYVADGYDDDQAESEVWDFWDTVRAKIYDGGISLGGRCAAIAETGQGVPVKPYVGEPGIGLATEFEIQFIDNTENL